MEIGLTTCYTLWRHKVTTTTICLFFLSKHVIFVKLMHTHERQSKIIIASTPSSQGRPQLTCLAPPINKLTFLKTAAFVLNFKLWHHPDNCLAPLSRLPWCRLRFKQKTISATLNKASYFALEHVALNQIRQNPWPDHRFYS